MAKEQEEKRPNGFGTINEIVDLVTGEITYRARLARSVDPSRKTLGTFDTRADAETALALGIRAIDGGAVKPTYGDRSFVKLGRAILDERELNGIKGHKQDRKRFEKHLATAPFATKDVSKITAADGAEWLRIMSRKKADDRRGERLLDPGSIQRCLSLACVILTECGPQGRALIDLNPFVGLKVKRKSEGTERDKWTFLTAEEQQAVLTCRAISDFDRWPILFSAGSGMRQGEQFKLRLDELFVAEDEEEPRAELRMTKNGKPHVVPLFGVALLAAREWLKIRDAFLTHPTTRKVAISDLAFPAPRGGKRGVGKPLGNGRFVPVKRGQKATHVAQSCWNRTEQKKCTPFRQARPGERPTHRWLDRLDEVLALAGITRNVRWHDMRHTCASSLISGDWSDEPYRIEEVKEHLNHSSISVTQRYAHLGETALKKAAKRIRPVERPEILVQTGPDEHMVKSSNPLSRLRDLNSRPTVYEGSRHDKNVERLAAILEDSGPDVDQKAILKLLGALATKLQSVHPEQGRKHDA